MRPTNRKFAASLLPAAAVAVSVVAAGVAGHAFGTHVYGGPRVGQIIAFEPWPEAEAEEGARLELRRPDHSYCVVDLTVVRRLGGSLVVESQGGDDSEGFRVHWAGQHTSDGAGDCGGDAILMTERQDLDRLASSAGGYLAAQTVAAIMHSGLPD